MCVMIKHHARKYAPPRSSVTDDCPLALQAVHVSKHHDTLNEGTWPQTGAKMRISKANKGAAVVRAVRRQASPQPSSLERMWSDRKLSNCGPEGRDGAEASGNGMEGHEGGPPRGRKKASKPHVKTIFSPEDKDPRVKEETGEGHAFEPGGERNWCDLCCMYIFENGLTCAGEGACD